jgi:hypothetical protein
MILVMAPQGGRVTTTVRLSAETAMKLKAYSFAAHGSQTKLIELALVEYFERHKLPGRYQLNVTKEHTVLVRIEGEKASVIEVSSRNGAAPETIAERYSSQLHSPVDLVLQEGEGASP